MFIESLYLVTPVPVPAMTTCCRNGCLVREIKIMGGGNECNVGGRQEKPNSALIKNGRDYS